MTNREQHIKSIKTRNAFYELKFDGDLLLYRTRVLLRLITLFSNKSNLTIPVNIVSEFSQSSFLGLFNCYHLTIVTNGLGKKKTRILPPIYLLRLPWSKTDRKFCSIVETEKDLNKRSIAWYVPRRYVVWPSVDTLDFLMKEFK